MGVKTGGEVSACHSCEKRQFAQSRDQVMGPKKSALLAYNHPKIEPVAKRALAGECHLLIFQVVINTVGNSAMRLKAKDNEQHAQSALNRSTYS